MHNVIKKILDCILCVSLIIFVCVFIAVTKMQGKVSVFITSILPAVQILLGLFAVYVALRVTKKGYQVFSSFLFLLLGLYQFLLMNKVIPFSLKETWPIIGVISSICLFISGYFRYRKIKILYIVPSLILVIMSLWYSLFSFKVIKQPFSFVVLSLGPAFVFISVTMLISFYFLQKKHRELIIEDEENEFDTEEICDFIDD